MSSVKRIKTVRTVEVTQEDIDYGIPNDSSRCTLERAIQRVFPEASEIKICNGFARLGMNQFGEWHYRIPRTAIHIPTLIDSNLKDQAEPTTFVLRNPTIAKKKETRKVKVKQHMRSLPGEGELGDTQPLTEARLNPGAEKSRAVRSAAARMRKALKEHLGAQGHRYLGNEI